MREQLKTDVCIIGGGPGGAMLAMLLARSGVKVFLLEKSVNPKREFRGESISPDSVAILEHLQIMPYLENHRYLQTKRMQVYDNQKCLLEVDFSRFNYDKKYSIDIPQPVLLSALLQEAQQHANFHYFPGAKCEALLKINNAVTGVTVQIEDKSVDIECSLVVAADGRYGKLRQLAGLSAHVTPLSRDVLWFMVKQPQNWNDTAKLCLDRDQHIIALPTYPDWLRVGLNIPSGQYKKIRQHDISYLHNLVAKLEPQLADSVRQDVKTWADTSLLDIFTMQVPQWAIDGFILIGDAAHTLTPVLGQGVNQAIKDAYLLSPIITRELNRNGQRPLSADLFSHFIQQRKSEVDFVHQFQVRQEKMLAISAGWRLKLRNFIYRFMNQSPRLQKVVWGKLLYRLQHTMAFNKS